MNEKPVVHVYRYDPHAYDLLVWTDEEADHAGGVTQAQFLRTQVASEPPGGPNGADQAGARRR
ncbi:hypothetical protein [Micropruina sp.]|uniref:hypothetical protein n=1 Tax=Micropruina sp. TaxID=2737536 RepID=UPI0039E323EF